MAEPSHFNKKQLCHFKSEQFYPSSKRSGRAYRVDMGQTAAANPGGSQSAASGQYCRAEKHGTIIYQEVGKSKSLS